MKSEDDNVFGEVSSHVSGIIAELDDKRVDEFMEFGREKFEKKEKKPQVRIDNWQ